MLFFTVFFCPNFWNVENLFATMRRDYGRIKKQLHAIIIDVSRVDRHYDPQLNCLVTHNAIAFTCMYRYHHRAYYCARECIYESE